MFNRRQLDIVIELLENSGNYFTASHFAKKQQVSLRTIQNDIKAIKDELTAYPCVEFQSAPPKGSRIVILDQTQLKEFKELLYHDYATSAMSYQSERITALLFLLLTQHRSISYYDLENTLFISRSTLLNDLKRADAVLQKYQLEMMRGSNKVFIDGGEAYKRMCIGEEKLIVGYVDAAAAEKLTKTIRDILVETFVAFKHNISEVDLSNMIYRLSIGVKRMENWFFLSPSDFEAERDLCTERRIAETVFARLADAFHIRIPDAEVDYFTLYLKGQGNYSSPEAIPPEVDELVLDGLREIRSVFDIDLTNDVGTRISLALHCTPMIVRIKYDMQMSNQLSGYVRQTFPQGFDIATHFASFLQKKFGKRVKDEEIALIAIHMAKALNDLQKSSGTKRILVISSLRRSENLLLRQTLCRWFENQIAELFFLPPTMMDETYLDRYDTFLTTEKGPYYDKGLALYINPFPERQDYLNVKLALDGFEHTNDILRIFHRDTFEVFSGEVSRNEVLNVMCKRAGKRFELEGLQEAVLERENMGSTFFGNGIAAPHPMVATSSDTFISIGISPLGVEWDNDGNRVHLVMLVNIGKNNAKAFQLWNYLSNVFARKDFVSLLLSDPTYDHFLKLLKDTIAKDFNI